MVLETLIFYVIIHQTTVLNKQILSGILYMLIGVITVYIPNLRYGALNGV